MARWQETASANAAHLRQRDVVAGVSDNGVISAPHRQLSAEQVEAVADVVVHVQRRRRTRADVVLGDDRKRALGRPQDCPVAVEPMGLALAIGCPDSTAIPGRVSVIALSSRGGMPRAVGWFDRERAGADR